VPSGPDRVEMIMKKTRINHAHYQLNGKMVDFAGWDLPVQYSGVKEEHLAVRHTGGIFDVSHMGEIFLRGPQALDAVQYISSNNAARLEPGRIQYSGLLTEKGCFVDDMLVHKLSDSEYLLVVNAANLEKDAAWIREKTETFNVEIHNESEEYSQIAIQGPKARVLLSQFTEADLQKIRYYSFVFTEIQGVAALISRTGYTGEDGFEVYFKSDEAFATSLFLDFVRQGESLGIVPAGLGARDTLRLEAGMALYGNDIDDSHTVLEAGLGWILKFKKKDFIGRDVLLRQKEEGIQRRLAGFEVFGRGIARHGYPVLWQGKEFSQVTSGTMAPFLNKAIGMTYLPPEATEPGTRFHIMIHNRDVEARVTKMPFYQRES